MRNTKTIVLIGLGLTLVGCSGPSWDDIRDDYTAKCQVEAKKSLTKYKDKLNLDVTAQKYCACMFDKLKVKYASPTEQVAAKDAKQVAIELAKECKSSFE